MTIIGTIVVSEFGGPVSPSAFGPSHPSAPTIHISEMKRPANVSRRSDRVRMNTSISAAISSSATPTSGAIPSSVALTYSSSTTMVEMLLALRTPSEPSAITLIFRSASAIRSSPVSCNRITATDTGPPSISGPPMAASAPCISGTPRTASISACDTAPNPSAPSAALMTDDGATTESPGASSAAISGSLNISPISPSICERPAGVKASPRKMSVTTLTSPASPNTASISSSVSATALPSGSVASVEGGGARKDAPAPIATVTASNTASVTHGRAVTTKLNLSSA